MKDPKNISELIARYLSGDLSPQEKHQFEKECEQDPFLQDMVDGYNENNVTPSDLKDLSDAWPPKKDNGFSKRNKWILGFSLTTILLLIVITTFYILPLSNSTTSNEEVSSNATKEVQNNKQELPKNSISEVETVSSSQIKKDQGELEQFESKIQPQKVVDTSQSKEVIDEPLEVLPKNGIQIPKNQIVNDLIKKKVNIKYFHNFKVMSYDQIRRKNILLVNNDRLSGLPASQEDEMINKHYSNSSDKKIDYNAYLEETIQFFSKEWYYRCLENCKTILKQYPHDMNASFYGAMCLLNLKAHKEALPYFQTVINSPYDVYYDESLFYYAIALKTSNPEKSQSILTKIVDAKGFYSDRAEKELQSFKN